MIRFLVALTDSCRRHAMPVLLAAIVLTGLGGLYVQHTLGINTDTSALIGANQGWQRQTTAFDAAFPQNKNDTTIVIDGSSADAVEDGTNALAAALSRRTETFHTVREPDSGPFFARYGLMFLSTAELSHLSDQVAEAQPLLGPLAADPSLRGLFGVLDQAVMGIAQGQASGDKFRGPLSAFAASVRSIVDGKPQAVDWSRMMTGQAPRPEQLRHFIQVQPVLDFDALEPGAAASKVIRDTAASLHLADRGLRVRLTGDVPIEDDEFASVTQGAGTATAVTAVAVVIILLLGLRAPRLIVAIVGTVVVGLVATAAFAAVAVGTLNAISIAFAVLFIGIGVDFGIQFSMRYRAELYAVTGGLVPTDRSAANAAAILRTARGISGPLGVAALATAVGFYSFLPTDYRGVSELGLIAGTSMIIALFTNLTVLPALLSLLQGRGRPDHAGFQWAAPIDRWLARNARVVVVLALLAGIVAIASVPFVRFDADPLDLKDPHQESVQTALDLIRDPLTSPYSIDVLLPSLKDAQALADTLGKLSVVKMVLSLASFVPEDQAAKLDILSQMQLFLGPVLDPGPPPDATTDAESRQAIVQFVAALKAANAGPAGASLAPAGADLAVALDQFLALPGGGDLALLQHALLGGLPGRLESLRQSVQAAKLTPETMPPEIRTEWLSADGHARLQVFPQGDMKNQQQLEAFVAAVRAAAPNATGAPVAILESGHTVSHAFVTASTTALIAIGLVLILVLRRLRDVALVMVPLILAGLYALGACVAVGLAFNYANVIAVPLLMGIGVAFDIYFVMAWRQGSGPVALLQTSTARAVVFSACTTTTAFGSLMLSHHVGTASMGLLLVLTLAFVVFCTLIVQPALMTVFGRGRRVVPGESKERTS